MLKYTYIYIYIYIYIYTGYIPTQWTTDAMITTHAMIKTQEDLFNIITSHFICKVRKGCSRFACERELETEHNWNILNPNLWPSRCVFLVLWCSTGAPEATLLGDGFLYGILSASSPDLNSSGPKGPFGLMWLSLPHLGSNWLELYWQLHWPTGRRTHLEPELNSNCPCHCQLPQHPSWLRYIIVQRLHDRTLDLCNRMFNRHQTEITVMQFRGHSLPVRQSMRVSWDIFTSSQFISQFPPKRFPLITAIRMCHFLPVYHLEWHFWPGQKVKTQH